MSMERYGNNFPPRPRCECCGRDVPTITVGYPDQSGHVWNRHVCEECDARCTTDDDGALVHAANDCRVSEAVVRHPVATLGGIVWDILIVRLPPGLSAREAEAFAREKIPACTVVEIR